MTRCASTGLSFAALLLLAQVAPAQDGASHDQNALLAKACAKMAELPGVAFRTIEHQDNAMMRQFRDRMPAGMDEETEVQGKWCNDVTQASLNYEDDEVVIHGGRMLARSGGDWKLRHNVLASGDALPFVLDPSLFFEVLSRLPGGQLEVRKSEPGKYRGNELTVLGVTLEDEDATDLRLCGIVPGSSGGFGGGGMMRRMRMMGGGGAPQDETTIDIAFYVDPESALIHRVRVKAYNKSAMFGQVVIQGAGMGDGEEEAEEDPVEEFDGEGERLYKKGLPVRKLGKELSLTDFDISFTDHGKTFSVDLDDSQRRLLRLK